MTDSQTYGLKIHSELTENFGEYFDIQTSGDKQVELSLKPEVLGRTSTPQLLGRLEDMTQFLGLALYRKAVKAAINASQDVQWVQRDGLDRLALTPAALERMAISEAPDASLAGPPRDRVLTLLEQAADGLMLSALKAAVATPLREKISALTERTGLLRNPLAGSSHDKAEFLNTLVDDLVASPDARGMLVRVDHACEAYKALRLGSSHARDGGNTAVLLADIRTAVQRYLQDPE